MGFTSKQIDEDMDAEDMRLIQLLYPAHKKREAQYLAWAIAKALGG